MGGASLLPVSAGGANAVGDITKGMIDQDRRLESAKAISDIDEQKQLRIAERAQQMRRDEQTYNTTGQGSGELLSFRQKQDKAALEAKVSEASNPELRQANIDNVNSLTLGTVDARVAAENALVNGTAPAKLQAAVAQATALLPIEIKRAYALADAAGSASERHRQQPGAELEAKLAIVEKTLGRKLTEQEQLGLLGLAKARDPELDTQTVTEEKMNPDGTTTKVTRKEVRRAGASGGDRPSESDAHAQAEAAIKAGANADAVNKVLAERGYKPLGGATKSDAKEQTKEQPKEDAAPVDRIGNGVIGILTPLARIEESARAGNQRAKAYLEKRAKARTEDATAPRSAADMMNGQ